MKKHLWVVSILALAVLVGAYVVFWKIEFDVNNFYFPEKTETVDTDSTFSDPRNGSYRVGEATVTFINGVSRVPAAPDSVSFVTTQYFGNEARGDIDRDGDEDIVFLITQDGGGSGTFFYLVAALRDGDNYRGSSAMFIGDRIAPQATEFRDGFVIVNYADRAPGEAMATVPSIRKSLYAKFDIDSDTFGEVVQNFEGEHTSTDSFSRLTARIGETVSGAGVSITVLRVLEDSRCPVDVTCVWEGRVRVEITLISGLGSGTQVFEIGQPITTEAEEVLLTQVTPTPRSTQTVTPQDYSFTFEVKKR